MSEIAYKYTRAGARSPFTGFTWRPHQWVDVDGDVALCVNGIHACRLEALPRWIDDELWRIELENLVDESDGVVVARRARLVDHITGWNSDTARELTQSCVAAARRLANSQEDPLFAAMADEIVKIAGSPDSSVTALTMYCTAHAFDVAFRDGYVVERKRQAEWLRERLKLQPA